MNWPQEVVYCPGCHRFRDCCLCHGGVGFRMSEERFREIVQIVSLIIARHDSVDTYEACALGDLLKEASRRRLETA